MLRMDLHMHSTASDGEHTPHELVSMAKAAGIAVMALTDHDTVNGIAEARAAAREAGIVFVPGVELSIDGWRELHMLGYGVDEKDAAFCAYLKALADDRVARGKRIVAYLAEMGVELSYEEILEQTNGVVARPHIAKEMVRRGYVKDVEEAFRKYLATEAFFRRDKRLRPSLKEGIEWIRAVGGVAVLAHPFSLKCTRGELDAIVKQAVSYGLGGLECEYSRYDEEKRVFLRDLAKKYGLIATRGSDYHGERVRPDVRLGEI